jgi:uncharacterized circularly permuted ATP-grasp superfamily protein
MATESRDLLLPLAIGAYHNLLTNDLAAESQDALDRELRQRGLYFGQRPLCTVLRPRFLTHDQYRFIQARVRVLMSAFAKAYHAAVADASIRSQFCLLDWEEELVQHDPGFTAPSPTSRLDAFFLPETNEFRCIEYNAEVPAGLAYNDSLSEAFFGLPIMREFMRQFDVRQLPARHGVLHPLITAYQQWSGRREPPVIAILDWREVPTFSEFVLFQQYFQSHGLRCVIADPRELEYRDGRLMAEDAQITLIYKRVLINELIERGGMDQPVVRAVLDNAACMVNPFRCKILHKKLSLAVLSDERNIGLFAGPELEAIASHIPWTRRVEERHTEYDGRQVDLLPFIRAERERLVLKPNDEYGGKGVILGWTVDDSTWESAVQTALTEPWVVQERTPVAYEPYPSWIDGQLHVIDRMQDTNPFISYGAYVDGCLTRLSTEALLNVTAGGGSSVPTFVVESRD